MSPRAKSAASAAPKKPATPRKKKVKATAGSVGLTADEVASGSPSTEINALKKQIEDAGGHVLAAYREPLGGHWVALAALPLDKVKPTPYQRELSKAHADRLATVIPKVGRFLDPVIAVPDGDRLHLAERHAPALRDDRARREVDRRARHAGARDRVPHPRAQHREGAQPQGQGTRGHSHGARDRRRFEAYRSERDGRRVRARAAVARHDRRLLREERAVLGRRVQLRRHAAASRSRPTRW